METITKKNRFLMMLQSLNTVAETWAIGRSLISTKSKDVDFVVIGNKDDYDKIMNLECVSAFKVLNNADSEYISDDFPWFEIIKGDNGQFLFDILFCDFFDNIHDIIESFPITKQHIAFREKEGVVRSRYFSEEHHFLELSPKRIQKDLSEGLKKVMHKYCEYYPYDDLGKNFLSVLKEFAFESLKKQTLK